jgi:hypothetical protein
MSKISGLEEGNPEESQAWKKESDDRQGSPPLQGIIP